MTSKLLKSLFNEGKIVWSKHILFRMQQRGIKIGDIVNCILSGEIIENYFDDFPYPSCLVFGYNYEKCLHVVCSVGENKVWMITAYYPDIEEWCEDLKTRRS